MSVTIAVGGRWREIEDENSQLQHQLAASEARFSAQKSELDAVCEKLKLATSELERLEVSNMSKTAEMHLLEESLNASTEEIGEMRAAAEVSASTIQLQNSQQQASAAEIEHLRRELEGELHQIGQMKSQLASKEQTLALESSLRRKAEARNELFHAEMCTLESRFAKQGTHVQLLLRDKERLWSQLSRTRIPKSESKEQSKQNVEPPAASVKVEAKTNRVRKSSNPRKIDVTVASSDLERKLWHTQKAGHTQVFLVLLETC